jgi:hypothetical protein
MKKIRRISFFVFLILFGYWIYQNYFRHIVYTDAENNCRVDIYPSFAYYNLDVQEAIKLLKLRSPDYYQKLCSYVTVISSDAKCGAGAAACAYGETKIGINRPNDKSIPGLAATLVHETCHFHQGRAAFKEHRINFSLAEREAECYGEQATFLNTVRK